MRGDFGNLRPKRNERKGKEKRLRKEMALSNLENIFM